MKMKDTTYVRKRKKHIKKLRKLLNERIKINKELKRLRREVEDWDSILIGE